jgi:hypothetical protein
MTPAQPALDEMMEGVTAGPWSASPVDPRRICDHRGLSVARAHLLGNYGTIEEAAANAAFIAAARELVPALAAEVRAQRETIAGLEARVEALTGALTAVADGDVPRPVKEPWSGLDTPSKHDICPHDLPMWQDCPGCIEDFARLALSGDTPNG